MPPSPRPPKPKGRQTHTKINSDTGTSLTVTSENGKPVSYEKWKTNTGRVVERGNFPLKPRK